MPITRSYISCGGKGLVILGSGHGLIKGAVKEGSMPHRLPRARRARGGGLWWQGGIPSNTIRTITPVFFSEGALVSLTSWNIAKAYI